MEGLVASHDAESHASSSLLVEAHLPDRSQDRSQNKKPSTMSVMYIATSYTQDAHIKLAKDQTTHSIIYLPCLPRVKQSPIWTPWQALCCEYEGREVLLYTAGGLNQSWYVNTRTPTRYLSSYTPMPKYMVNRTLPV